MIPSGSRVMFGGFLGCGSALDVIRAIDESDVEKSRVCLVTALTEWAGTARTITAGRG